jgi:hypothetical protein
MRIRLDGPVSSSWATDQALPARRGSPPASPEAPLTPKCRAARLRRAGAVAHRGRRRAAGRSGAAAPPPGPRRRPHPRRQRHRTGQPALHDFAQNEIWCALVALAADLTAWMQTLTQTGHDARRWEPKRLRLLSIPHAMPAPAAAGCCTWPPPPRSPPSHCRPWPPSTD